MKRFPLLISLAAALVWLLPVMGPSAGSAQATPIQVGYQISASNFVDSNSNPPNALTSTAVNGTYTFTFDTAIPSQVGIVPDKVTGFNITDKNGATIGFDEMDSGINTAVNIYLDVVTFTIGGNVNGVSSVVGLSNDFRLSFEASLIDFEVMEIFDFGKLSFVSTVDPYYAGDASINLISFLILPEPASLVLVNLGGLLLMKRRRDR